MQGEAAARAAAEATRGEFAVAVSDAASGRCFLAVDRFALRTLCYRVANGHLAYAERADELADEDTELDVQAIFDYLYFHCIPAPRTIFKGVYRLAPGHCAWFEGGRLTVRPYWVPAFEEPTAPPSLEALKRQFRQLVQDAVATQLDGTVPACFLSGGTDSSTVAGMVGLATGAPAHTYSIGFEAEGYDEMAFARLAAAHFNTVHHEYYVTPADLVRSIPDVARHHDQPFGNSSALPAFYCAKMARDNGVSRLLAGDGGDELFGGNSRYAKQRIFDAYGHVPVALRHGVLEPLLQRTPLGRWPGFSKARSYVEQAGTPMPDRLQLYNLMCRLGLHEVLTADFLARVDPQGPLTLQQEVWQHANANCALNRTLAYDWRFTLADSDLPKVRGAAAMAGVSVGFPLLDQALTDFSCALPESYKLKGLKLRWFFKEALRGFLPDDILTKKKQGFGLPFGVWAMRHTPLKTLAVDALRNLGTRGVVRPEFIQTLVNQRLPEHPGYYGEMVWVLMMLEQWLQGREAGPRSKKFTLG